MIGGIGVPIGRMAIRWMEGGGIALSARWGRALTKPPPVVAVVDGGKKMVDSRVCGNDGRAACAQK
ncbi:MAG: hypothetical protein D8M59_14030 [Planctomycetes bacterium]|nr:hypothetical protein [Planctomycetota bacterium]